MHTYVLLKNGTILILWSDNTDDENMDCYPSDLGRLFDVESDDLITVDYSDVALTDTNIYVLENKLATMTCSK
jgi:hypothetical protein